MTNELKEELKVIRKLLLDIHKLHFSDMGKQQANSLKDRFKADILMGIRGNQKPKNS